MALKHSRRGLARWPKSISRIHTEKEKSDNHRLSHDLHGHIVSCV